MLTLRICLKSGSPSPLTRGLGHGCKFARRSLRSAEQRARAGSWGGMEGCTVTPPKTPDQSASILPWLCHHQAGTGGVTEDAVPKP